MYYITEYQLQQLKNWHGKDSATRGVLREIESQKEIKLWKVVHQCFATDHVSFTSSVIYAENKKTALEKYNQIAKERKEYPYMWDEVTLEDVEELEIL